jgi:hypothetical protein
VFVCSIIGASSSPLRERVTSASPRFFQIQPDFVAKYQPIDIAEVISWRIM